MRFFALAPVAFALGILPGSCIAAAPPPPKPQPPAPKPVTAPRPAPLAVGKFRLDANPLQGGISRGFVPAGTKRLVVNGEEVDFAADGRFIIGYGRDYAASVLITALLDGGTSITEKLPVTKRSWKIDNLKTLPHHSQPDAEYQARRPLEINQINAARKIAVMSEGWRQKFIWPAKGRISGVFGSQRIYAGEPGSPHSGVDVALPTGSPVMSPADGEIVLAAASPFTLEGNLLVINHGMGMSTYFLHLSRIDVKKGDKVKQGQLVGAIGMTGRATGPHLHWSLRWHNERMDPQPFAGPM